MVIGNPLFWLADITVTVLFNAYFESDIFIPFKALKFEEIPSSRIDTNDE